MHKPASFKEVNHRANLKDAKHSLPEEGYLRLWQIVGGKGCPAVLPISKSSFWAGIRQGIYPAPIRFGKRISLWRVQEIRKLLEAENKR